MLDLVIRAVDVCLPDGLHKADIAIEEGVIVGIGAGYSGREEIDGRGKVVIPGAIDAHVHYNEPGRTEWEGWATGSAASAAGGATTVFEMPLNAHPPTLDAESFALKHAAAKAVSKVDFGLWGGLTPSNIDKLGELAECGVVGFKAFMSESGMDDFPRADYKTLRKGMGRASKLGAMIAVHAEDETMTSALAERVLREGRVGMMDYLQSRPIDAECEAIRIACDIAGETECRLHVVHVSSGEGLSIIRSAAACGVNVSAETCPHYLFFNEEDAVRLGAEAKCAPPIRKEKVRLDLLRRVCAGEVDTIGSDHSPSPPSMKVGTNFFKIWGGIMGAQQFLPALCAVGLDAEMISRLTAQNVAARFGIMERKGTIALGKDADLVMLDMDRMELCKKEELLTRHAMSPYIGYKFPAKILATWVRGKSEGQHGRLIKCGPLAK